MSSASLTSCCDADSTTLAMYSCTTGEGTMISHNVFIITVVFSVTTLSVPGHAYRLMFPNSMKLMWVHWARNVYGCTVLTNSFWCYGFCYFDRSTLLALLVRTHQHPRQSGPVQEAMLPCQTLLCYINISSEYFKPYSTLEPVHQRFFMMFRWIPREE